MRSTRHAAGAVTLFILSIAAVALTAPVASSGAAIAQCKSVKASGGDYDGFGGMIYAELKITNTGHAPCTITGRPWVRLPRLPQPVTVADWSADPLAGEPGRSLILDHGQQARAYLRIDPGRCDRSKGTTFTLWAHAGYGDKSVTIVGPACDDGSGRILLGSFRR
jgi:hypothetical protein